MKMKWYDVNDFKNPPLDSTLVHIYIPKMAVRDAEIRATYGEGPGTIKKPDGVYEGYYLNSAQAWYMSGSPSHWNVSHWYPIPEFN